MPHRVLEFHNIQPVENIDLILSYGILSYNQASKLPHKSIAMANLQNIRDNKRIPDGFLIHHYACLYFDARNPMLYKRINEGENLCVFRVSKEIDTIQGVVFSDQNASSHYARFYSPGEGYERLDFDAIYATDWRHEEDQIAYWRHKSKKCAEVLVPHEVPVAFITGIYTFNKNMRQYIQKRCSQIPVIIRPDLFFKRGNDDQGLNR